MQRELEGHPRRRGVRHLRAGLRRRRDVATRSGSPLEMGPGYFPFVLGGLLALLGAVDRREGLPGR